MGETNKIKEDIADILPKKKNILGIFHKKESKVKVPKFPPIPKIKKNIPSIPLSPHFKVHHTKKFKFANGKTARNVPEMVNVLSSLSEISLKKHTIKDKHQISTWIKKNYHNHKLADKLSKTNKKNKIIKLLGKHVLDHEEIPSFKEEPLIESFKNIEPPKPVKQTLPPKSPEKSGGELANLLPSLEDNLIPPEPTKDMLVKRSKLNKFKNILKKSSIPQHQEFDQLISMEEETKRITKKKNLLSKQEKSLTERELKVNSESESYRREENRLSSMKKIMDHDVRERIKNINSKEESVRKLKSNLLKERKEIGEKDQVLDKLRKRYLETIAKEEELEKRELKIGEKETTLRESKKKLLQLQKNLDSKYDSLHKFKLDMDTEFKGDVIKFENLFNIINLKKQEMRPQLTKFEKDIILFTKKEKIINEKFIHSKKLQKTVFKKSLQIKSHLAELTKKQIKFEKETNDFNLKKIELTQREKQLTKLDKQLTATRNLEFENREKLFVQKQKQLTKQLTKLEKNKLLKENTQKLTTLLKSLNAQIKLKSKQLLILSKKELNTKKLKQELSEKKVFLSKKEQSLKEEHKLMLEKQNQMEEMMNEKFHSYLKETMATVPKVQHHNKTYKHNQIYILIDNCNELLDLGKLSEARNLYNKIRHTFLDLNLRGTESQILKETIRDLYKKINLSSVK